MTDIINSLKVAQGQLQNASNNIGNVNNSSATAKIKPTTARIIGDKLSQVPGKIERANSDYSLFLRSFEVSSRYAQENAVAESFASLGQYFDPTSSSSLKKIQSNFEANLQSLKEEPMSKAKTDAVTDSLRGLVQCVKGSAEHISASRNSAASSIASNVDMANDLLSQLGEINVTIASAEQPALYYDQRDALIRDLSEVFEIKVSLNDKKQALISLKRGGECLVDRGSNATLRFDAGGNDGSGSLLVSNYGVQESEITSQTRGGKIGGLLKFVNQVLPEISKRVDAYADALVKTINTEFNVPSNLMSGSSSNDIYFDESLLTAPEISAKFASEASIETTLSLLKTSLYPVEKNLTSHYLSSWSNAQDSSESLKSSLEDVFYSLKEKTGVDNQQALMEAYQIQAHIAALMNVWQVMEKARNQIQAAIERVS
jgi:flagellar hook-associated protein FlgK